MTKKKGKQKPVGDTKAPARSEIIEQCVIYAQSIAAFNAGFKIDHTGDSDAAGSDGRGGPCLRKAKRALHRLVALSPACMTGKPPLSPQELHSKASVLGIIGMETNSFKEPMNIEGAYIRFFAAEVEDYFRSTTTGHD